MGLLDRSDRGGVSSPLSPSGGGGGGGSASGGAGAIQLSDGAAGFASDSDFTFAANILNVGQLQAHVSHTDAWWGSAAPAIVIDPDTITSDHILFGSMDSATGNNQYHAIELRSGQVTGASATIGSGELYIGSGDVQNSNQASGYVELRSGNTTGSGNSGIIAILTGVSGSGTRGYVSLDGQYITCNSKQIRAVATPTAADHAATKDYVDSNGANTLLSNLGVTSINADLIPSASGVRKLGSASVYWQEIRVQDQFSNGDMTLHTGAGSALQLYGNVGGSAAGRLYFRDLDSTNYVGFKGPDVVSSNVVWTLPSADGTSGQVLSTNGSATLSWVTAGGITWATPINSNITVDTNNAYDLGTGSMALKTIYASSEFSVYDGTEYAGSLYGGGMEVRSDTANVQFRHEIYENTDPDGGTSYFGQLYTDGPSDPAMDILSQSKLWVRSSAAMKILTLASAASATAAVTLDTGDQTGSSGTLASGLLALTTGDVTNAGNSGATGAISLTTGNAAGSGNSGSISLITGTSASGARGKIWFQDWFNFAITDSLTSTWGADIPALIINGDASDVATGTAAAIMMDGDSTTDFFISTRDGVGGDTGSTSRLLLTTGYGTTGQQSGALIIGTGESDTLTGSINIATGFSGGNSGSIDLNCGQSTGGTGGAINLYGGVSTGGSNGGSINLTGGAGTPGGDITLTAGDSDSSQAGGNVFLVSGAATAGNASGGNIQFITGAGVGTGHTGDVDMISVRTLKLPRLSADPTGDLGKGSMYFNTTTNKIKVYNGTTWETVTST